MNSSVSIAPPIDRLAPLFPQLQIHGLVGVGELSAVFKAEQTSLDRVVALKILPEEFSDNETLVEGFSAAARAMAPLVHPNLSRIYDFGESDGLLWMIQEWSSGRSVREMLGDGPIDLDETGRLMSEVCRALENAHEHGAIHGDLRASNVMVSDAGRVKVMDLGFGRLAREAGGKRALSVVAPELLDPDLEVDHRADIFALGMLLYEMLVGERPVGEIECPSVLRPGLDPAFDVIIGKCLEPRAGLRYDDCASLRHDLEQLIPTIAGIDSSALPQPTTTHFVAPPASPVRTLASPLPRPAMVQTSGGGGAKWAWIGALTALVIGVGWVISAKMRAINDLEERHNAKVEEVERKVRENEEKMRQAKASERARELAKELAATTADRNSDPENSSSIDTGSATSTGLEPGENGSAMNEDPGPITDPPAEDPELGAGDGPELPPLAPALARLAPEIPELETLRKHLQTNAAEALGSIEPQLGALRKRYTAECEKQLASAGTDEAEFWETELDSMARRNRPPCDFPITAPPAAGEMRAGWRRDFVQALKPLTRLRGIYIKQLGDIRANYSRKGLDPEVEALRLEESAAEQPDYFFAVCCDREEQCGAMVPGNVGHSSMGAVGSGVGNPEHLNDGISNPSSGKINKPIELELGGLLRLSQIRFELNQHNPDHFFRYKLLVSPDGENWDLVCDRSESGEWSNWQEINFTPRPVRYIQLIGTFNSLHNGFIMVRDLEAYCVASS